MFAATIPILAIAVSTPPPVARVEVQQGPESTQIVAFDTEAQVAAEIVVWIVGDGYIRIDAIFPDDVHAMAVVDWNGEIIEIDNEEYERVAPRIAAVVDFLAETEQAGWVPCALHGAMAVVELAHANPIGVASAVLAACECLPLIIDEFEDIKCPGF